MDPSVIQHHTASEEEIRPGETLINECDKLGAIVQVVLGLMGWKTTYEITRSTKVPSGFNVQFYCSNKNIKINKSFVFMNNQDINMGAMSGLISGELIVAAIDIAMGQVFK